MKFGFWFLWMLWGFGVAYQLIVSGLGIFPARTLAQRMETELDIAWFILTAWLIWRWTTWAEARRSRSMSNRQSN